MPPSAMAVDNGIRAGVAESGAAQSACVPLSLVLDGGVDVETLQFAVRVEAPAGEPDLTTAISFEAGAGPAGAPTVSFPDGNSILGMAWLSALDPPLSGTVDLGTLEVPIPDGATPGAVYGVRVLSAAGGAPGGTSSIDQEEENGSVTVVVANQISAAAVSGVAGTTVAVPIRAQIAAVSPAATLQFGLSVVPLDGAPDLDAAISFTKSAEVSANPSFVIPKGSDFLALAWLDPLDPVLVGNIDLGTLNVPIPAEAASGAAYQVVISGASGGRPDGETPVLFDVEAGQIDVLPDNCPYADNPGQEDGGAIGAGSDQDGIGDACQCGDVNGSGAVTTTDSVIVLRAQLVPPTATLAFPELCDVGGPVGCSQTYSVIILRQLLLPPTAEVMQQCTPANPPAPVARAARAATAPGAQVSVAPQEIALGASAAIDIWLDPAGSPIAAFLMSFSLDPNQIRLVRIDASPGTFSSRDVEAAQLSLAATFATDQWQPIFVGTVVVEGLRAGATLVLDGFNVTLGDCSEQTSSTHRSVAIVGGEPNGGPTPTATPAQVLECTGDCSGDATVTVDEVTTLSSAALRGGVPVSCASGDRDGYGSISVDEIVAAVMAALSGCD